MQSRKVILITGASSGIGKATAMQLLDDGHIVYGAARRKDKMQDITDQGGHALYLDVTKEESIDRAVHRILQAHGRIDVLVNNAGYAIYGPVEEVTLAEARRQFDVNLFGLAAVTKRVIPIMRQQKTGTIINMSSMGGRIYTPLGAWYHASKHALEGWSDCLRLELQPFDIDVVVIEPGIIDTEFGDVMLDNVGTEEGFKDSPYSAMEEAVVAATHKSYASGNASPPRVIARLISKAVYSKRPKTRYAGGKMAKLLMWIRKYLGDRIFDRAVMSQV